METERLAAEFQRQVATAGERGRTTAYPLETRVLAVAFVEARSAQGVTISAACKEIGIGRDTYVRWKRSLSTASAPTPEQLPSFRPVEIAAPAALQPSSLIVHGPLGLRIEGLDVAGLAALLQALS